MRPLSVRWHQLVRAAQCWCGDHNWMTDASSLADGTPTPTLYQRCLYCRRQSPGVTLDAPHYAYSAGMERPALRLTLHNPRLRRCPCVACETRRRERRSQRAKVQPLRKTA